MKKPSTPVNTTRSVGGFSKTENATPHTTNGNKTTSSGAPVYGKPLMSAAAAKVK